MINKLQQVHVALQVGQGYVSQCGRDNREYDSLSSLFFLIKRGYPTYLNNWTLCLLTILALKFVNNCFLLLVHTDVSKKMSDA